MERDGGSKEKETFAEQKQKARDQYAPFINESINILLDMVMLESGLPGSADVNHCGGRAWALNKDSGLSGTIRW